MALPNQRFTRVPWGAASERSQHGAHRVGCDVVMEILFRIDGPVPGYFHPSLWRKWLTGIGD